MASYWWIFLLLAVLLLLVVIIVIIVVAMRKKKQEEEEAQEPLPEPQAMDQQLPPPAPMAGPAPMPEPAGPPLQYQEPEPSFGNDQPGYEDQNLPEPSEGPAFGETLPAEEMPPSDQPMLEGGFEALAVQCYNCGGDIQVDTDERPAVLTCPGCGVQSQLD